MWTFATDVDGTLTGDRAALDRLAERLRQLRAAGQLFLVLSTGRRLEQVISGLTDEGLPQPDAVLCQVGTEIYIPPLSPDSQPLTAWRENLLAEYSRAEAVSFLQQVPGLIMQPDEFNTELKTSCFLDRCPDPDAAAAQIRERVDLYADRYQVVWSSSRDLDILPGSSGKGKAIRFLIEHFALDPERVVVAGDTGNDVAMFEQYRKGVVVANAKPELIAFANSAAGRGTYVARQPHAAGVEEGLAHYGVLAEADAGN